MTATKVQLIGGLFQDAEGNPLALGRLTLQLSNDENVAGVGNICSGIVDTILLNSLGSASITPPQYAWGCDQMLPINAYYRVTGYTAAGALAWGPNLQQIIGSGGTFDLGTWVPNSVFSWTPPPQPVSLQVNGVAASSQVLQNLVAGPDITLTDEGGGNIEITASSGSSVASSDIMTGVRGFTAPQVNININNYGATGVSFGNGYSAPTYTPASAAASACYGFYIPASTNENLPWGESPINAGSGLGFSQLYSNLIAFTARARQYGITGVGDAFIGMGDGGARALYDVDDPNNTNTVAFRYAPDISPNWYAYVSNGATSTTVDTGVVVDTNFHAFKIVFASGSSTFYIDGTQVAQITTDLPTTASIGFFLSIYSISPPSQVGWEIVSAWWQDD